MQIIKQKLTSLNVTTKLLIIFTGILGIFGFLSFISKGISNIAFYVFSAWCLYFLFWLIYNSYRVSKIKITKKEWVIITIFCLLILGMYCYVILNRIQLYQWDNSNYYIANLKLFNFFDQSFFAGIKNIIATTIKDSYGRFLLCFTSFIFRLTNLKEDAFIISYAITLVIPTYLVFTFMIKKIANNICLKKSSNILFFSSLLFLMFPLLHRSAIIGQPDIVGLIFVGLIILLTIDYDFKKVEWDRYFLIIISIICLLISRRWYMYWLLGYAICYALYSFFKAFKIKDKEEQKSNIRHIIMFGVLCYSIISLLLFPMFLRILNQDFSSYTSWNVSGYIGELNAELHRLGLWYVLMILIGLLIGLINYKSRKIAFLSLGTYLIAYLVFVRTQNMGYHHLLMVMPTFFTAVILLRCGLENIPQKYLKYPLILGMYAIIITTYIGIFTSNNKFINNNLFYPNINIRPIKRSDYQVIGEIVNFIEENTTKDDRVYINAASQDYCGQTFSGYIHPDLYLTNIIAYESSIDSAHGFPIKDMATAKYIFTTNVRIEATGAVKGHIIPAINEALNNDTVIRQKFTLVKEYKMNDKITFYAYERIKPFDEKEANYWLDVLQEPSQSYPKLFSERIEKYLSEWKERSCCDEKKESFVCCSTLL